MKHSIPSVELPLLLLLLLLLPLVTNKKSQLHDEIYGRVSSELISSFSLEIHSSLCLPASKVKCQLFFLRKVMEVHERTTLIRPVSPISQEKGCR
jgi:hypothetical protein